MISDFFDNIKDCELVDRVYVYGNKLLIVSDEEDDLNLFQEIYSRDESFFDYEIIRLKTEEFKKYQLWIEFDTYDNKDEVVCEIITIIKFGVCNKSVSSS